MIAYIVRRLLLAVVTIWAISVASFVIIQLPPGDFVDAYISRLSASGSRTAAIPSAILLAPRATQPTSNRYQHLPPSSLAAAADRLPALAHRRRKLLHPAAAPEFVSSCATVRAVCYL